MSTTFTVWVGYRLGVGWVQTGCEVGINRLFENLFLKTLTERRIGNRLGVGWVWIDYVWGI